MYVIDTIKTTATITIKKTTPNLNDNLNTIQQENKHTHKNNKKNKNQTDRITKNKRKRITSTISTIKPNTNNKKHQQTKHDHNPYI